MKWWFGCLCSIAVGSAVAFISATAPKAQTSFDGPDWKSKLQQAIRDEIGLAQFRNVWSGISKVGTVYVLKKVVPSHVGFWEDFMGGGSDRVTTPDFKIGDRVYVFDVKIESETKITLGLIGVETFTISRRGTTTDIHNACRTTYEISRSIKGHTPKWVISALRTSLDSEAIGSAPKTIGLGQTLEQVEAILGKPDTIANTGANKTIYFYKNLKVTFTDGKVTDIQ